MTATSVATVVSFTHPLPRHRRRPVTAAAPALDVGAAVTRLRRIQATLPSSAVHFAVSAGPEAGLLSALAAAGSRFAVAGPAEVTAALRAGAAPADLVPTRPVRRREDVVFALRRGIRLFVVDEPGAIQLLSDVAPGASVLCRIGTPATPGCSPEQAVGVLRESARRGLDPAGVSFHLGSGQGDPSAWDAPVGRSARVLTRLRADGFAPWLLDLGGGLPAHLDGSAYPLASYGAAIERSLRRHFPQDRPATIVEPGRAVVADAR